MRHWPYILVPRFANLYLKNATVMLNIRGDLSGKLNHSEILYNLVDIFLVIYSRAVDEVVQSANDRGWVNIA